MTIATERYNSIIMTEKLLCKILADKKVPQEIRDDARRCIKHYPSENYMELIAEQAHEWVENPKRKTND
jgi:uncharacterized protein (UPF0147 family)